MNRIGVHALVWAGGWNEEQSRHAITGAAGLGYDFVEIPVRRPHAIEIGRTVRLLEEYGIGASCGLALGFDTDITSSDPEVAGAGETLLGDALAAARDLGSRHLVGVIHSPLGRHTAPPTEDGRKRAAGVLARLADKAAGMDMTLALEAVNRYENNLVNTGAQALGLIVAIGADNVVVHLDTYHMNIEEADPAATIEACGDRLGYFHVGESHRGYLGTGSVDFPAIFRSLVRIGYAGPISLESFSTAVVDPGLSNTLAIWRDTWSDSADLAARAKGFIDAGMAAARAELT